MYITCYSFKSVQSIGFEQFIMDTTITTNSRIFPPPPKEALYLLAGILLAPFSSPWQKNCLVSVSMDLCLI